MGVAGVVYQECGFVNIGSFLISIYWEPMLARHCAEC